MMAMTVKYEDYDTAKLLNYAMGPESVQDVYCQGGIVVIIETYG